MTIQTEQKELKYIGWFRSMSQKEPNRKRKSPCTEFVLVTNKIPQLDFEKIMTGVLDGHCVEITIHYEEGYYAKKYPPRPDSTTEIDAIHSNNQVKQE